MKRMIKMLVIILTFGVRLAAQGTSGSIVGNVVDDRSEPVISAVVQAFQGGIMKGGTTTDFDGNYVIKPLQPGRYDVTVKYIGYKESKTVGIIVSVGKPTEVKFKLNPSTTLDEIVIVDYKVPLIDKYSGSNTTIMSDQLESMPTRNTSNMVSTASGRRGRQKTVLANPVYYNPSVESYKKEPENDYKTVKANPLSTISVDVDRASYSNIRRFLNEGQLPPADAVRIEEMINYFNYSYPQPEGNDPIAIVTELTDCPWQPDHQLLHIGMQARTMAVETLPASNMVFLVDVSGSMSSPNKLPLVIESLKLLAHNLRAKDKIAIVVYAGSAGMVLPPTPGDQKQAIYEALDRLQAGGSTAGGAGIKLAYKIANDNYIRGGNNRIVLATDGDFNVGISGDNELERLITKERESGIYLTCLGYGMGNYKDSKMEVLADKGNGNYAYIDNIEEAKKTLVKEFGGTVFTIAKDVKTQIEFNPALVQAYRLVGYENRLLNEEDFKDDKKDAGDMGSGHSVTIIYEIIPAGVRSGKIRDVSDLKYQGMQPGNITGELATVKFRYKRPNGKTSMEMSHVIANNMHNISEARPDIQFAGSVAMFGMLLKDSAYKGTSTYDKVLTLGKAGKGDDNEGYRAEYLKLVKIARKLTPTKVTKEDEELVGWFAEEN
ncbi:MAG: von Willebrand factor type A domain-containing protein [Chitinophagaceae bacterium]|nr:von Willebrand factor type A domain-containing protein [Chitinophagaceae bacterium]MCB9046005.1 von Willebrand factor type A domain-containing protein [Chitinophagales bacterium]